MPAPRLVILSRNLPPLRGGMERLSLSLITALKDDYACFVIGPAGCVAGLPAAVEAVECRSDRAPPYLLESAARIVGGAWRRPRPALVLATSGLTAPLAWLQARLSGCAYVVCVHGLDVVVDSALYQRLFVPHIRAAALVIANSQSTATLAVDAGVPRERIAIVHPGVSAPAVDTVDSGFRARHGLGDGPVLLAVGRLMARKGIAEFITGCLPALRAAEPTLQFVVIGDAATKAIHREASVRERIEAAIAGADVRAAVHLLGSVEDAELEAAYREADVHVFPLVRVRGDVEGFGMVAAEAALRGVPSVAFAEGGVVDAIVPGVTGELVASGDYAGFTAAVLRELEQRGDAGRRERCRSAAARYSEAHYAAAMRAALRPLAASADSR